MAGDITRITLNVLNLANSEYIDSLSDHELGQWLRLFCKAVLLAKECTLPVDEKALAGYTKLGKLSQRVLDAYPIVSTEFGQRRRNAVLYAEWVQVCGRSEASSQAADEKWKRARAKKSLESTKDVCGRNADALEAQSECNANRTEHNITEHNRTEQNKTEIHPITASMSEMDADRTTPNPGGLKEGDPGYFRRMQYPGTSMKNVWQHCERAWIRARKSDAAVCRFPTKHPAAKTFVFEDLCANHSADLIVPAFELWIQKEGQFIETQWPLSEFLKGSNPQDFMAMVMPLNEAKQKITADQTAATNLHALEAWCLQNPSQHAKVIDGKIVCHPLQKEDLESKPEAEALFGPEENK